MFKCLARALSFGGILTPIRVALNPIADYAEAVPVAPCGYQWLNAQYAAGFFREMGNW